MLYFEEVDFDVFFWNEKWRVQKRDEILRYWYWGHGDLSGMYSLGGCIGYVAKYITKTQYASLEDERDNKAVLSLAMMWIFRKRAFSISRGFESLVLKDKKMEVKRYRGQVDLEGNPIYKWVLVGFWAGKLDVWSKDLTYYEFRIIYGSERFTPNINII